MRSASRLQQPESRASSRASYRNEPRLPSSTTRWYEAHVRRFGYGYRALGFGRRSSQEKRFGAILGVRNRRTIPPCGLIALPSMTTLR